MLPYSLSVTTTTQLVFRNLRATFPQPPNRQEAAVVSGTVGVQRHPEAWREGGPRWLFTQPPAQVCAPHRSPCPEGRGTPLAPALHTSHKQAEVTGEELESQEGNSPLRCQPAGKGDWHGQDNAIAFGKRKSREVAGGTRELWMSPSPPTLTTRGDTGLSSVDPNSAERPV